MGGWNLHLIEQAFAQAATDVHAWKAALDTLVAETGSHGALIFSLGGTQLPTLLATERMLPATEAYVRDGWSERDERFRAVPLLRRTSVVDDFDIFSAETMKRHPYFQEFLRPFGLAGYAGIKVTNGDSLWSISLQRNTRQPHFTDEDKRRLATLSGSLSSAAAVSAALGFAAAEAALNAFEISDSAAVVVDKKGEILRANARAEQVLRGDVRIVRRRLVAMDTNATAELDRALSRLLWLPDEAALSPPIALPRREQLPLMAYPLRLADLAANPFAAGRAIIILRDPEERARPPEDELRQVFGLTVAEARLAARLASGAELKDVSAELGIARETSRHHLKNIFAKTGVRRQAELVAVFARMLALTSFGP